MGNAPSIYVISLSEWALSPWDVRVCDRKWGRITSASGKGLWTGDITISPLRVRAIFGHFLPIFCSVQTATSLCKKKKAWVRIQPCPCQYRTRHILDTRMKGVVSYLCFILSCYFLAFVFLSFRLYWNLL